MSMYKKLGNEEIMAEADHTYRKYITELDCSNDCHGMFKILDKIGLVN